MEPKQNVRNQDISSEKMTRMAYKREIAAKDSEREAEKKEEKDAEMEWKHRLHEPLSGTIAISKDPIARKIYRGFKINQMNMKDANNGKLMWQSGEWGPEIFDQEQEAHIPASILDCTSVSREINFSSVEQIENFRLEQRVYFHGRVLEEWSFMFGFVIPGSTNTWQQTIGGAGEGNMLDPSLVSGQITIETIFYNDDMFIAKTVIRIYYDGDEL